MLSDEDLLTLYEWIDSIPLSRDKKNIARDFCDGVLMAEIMKHYYPKLVDIYNYPEANSTQLKLTNWNTLCLKVFRKIGFSLSKNELENVVNSKPKAIENVLWRLYNKLISIGKIRKKIESKNDF